MSAVNSTKNSIKKVPGKPFVKDDPRINRKGAPVRGTTLTDAFKDVFDKTAEEAAEIYGGTKNELGRFFLKLPKGVPIRYLIAGRNVTAEIAEPNARRLATMYERLEGKVVTPVDVTSKGEQIGNENGDLRAEILRKLDSLSTAAGAPEVSGKPDE